MRLKLPFVAFVGNFRESTPLAAPSTASLRGGRGKDIAATFLHFSPLLSERIILQVMGGNCEEHHQ